jgi:hypothetical protein
MEKPFFCISASPSSFSKICSVAGFWNLTLPSSAIAGTRARHQFLLHSSMPSNKAGKPATLLSSSSYLHFAILAAYTPEPK